MLSLLDVDIKGKQVLLRQDLNCPIQDGEISDDSRLVAALPTIVACLQKGAALTILSHRGRPKEGQYDAQCSLAPMAKALENLLGKPVRLERDIFSAKAPSPGEVVMAENVRFWSGEKANDAELSKRLAKLCDVFVMDAFATAHRAQASTCGVIEYAPQACAGPLLLSELSSLSDALTTPARPLLAIVGGAKVSTKITLLSELIKRVDALLLGGGIANTFLVAAGFSVGQSLHEPDFVDYAKEVMQQAKELGVNIPLPMDVCVADSFAKDASCRVCAVDEVKEHEMILDVGPVTASSYVALLKPMQTVIWNGPVGVFEWPSFAKGTKALGEAIIESDAYTLAGGGDTVAACAAFGWLDQLSYVSTGGGAFLEWLEGKCLPAVAALEKRG